MLIAILKWLALLPVALLGKLATILCAPVAALLSMRGDALPRWQRWILPTWPMEAMLEARTLRTSPEGIRKRA